MANEYVFFAQLAVVIGFSLAALKMGKEALITWVVIQVLVANLFVLKQIALFGLNGTASDAFAVGSLLSLNLLQERFGREAAAKATWIGFFSMIFFALVSQLHLLYSPNLHDTTQMAFHTIFSPSPRLVAASIGVAFVVQRTSIRFFALLQKAIPQVHLILRTALSLVFAELLDTVLFSFAGLYGMVASVAEVILLSLLIKLATIFFFTSFMALTPSQVKT